MSYELPNSYPEALMVIAPGAQWSMTDNNDYSTLSWYSVDIPQPTQSQCDAEIAVLNADQPLTNCKNQASKLLYQTDWTTIPDVADPNKSNPYLVNSAAFNTYRNAVRQYIVYPVENPVFPTIPTAQWSS